MEHIYLYGDIYSEDSEFAESYGIVSMSTIQRQLAAIQGDEITVHIRSNGGSVIEGFGIYDILKTSGKKITTIAEGMCASIATVIFLAGDERKITENCEFLIHMPWGLAIGTADDLENAADEIREAEDKIIDFYVAKTGADREILVSYMEKDKVIDAKQAKNLGFATEIVQTVSNEIRQNFIAAQIKSKTDIMTILDKLTGLKNSMFPPKTEEEAPIEILALDVITANAEVTLRIQADGDPNVGDAVTLASGGSADGEHLMPNGDKYIVASGKLTEIQPKEVIEENPEVTELQAKVDEQAEIIATKDAEILALTTEHTDLKNSMLDLEAKVDAEIEEIKRLTVSNYKAPEKEEQFRKTEESEQTLNEKIKAKLEERKNKK